MPQNEDFDYIESEISRLKGVSGGQHIQNALDRIQQMRGTNKPSEPPPADKPPQGHEKTVAEEQSLTGEPPAEQVAPSAERVQDTTVGSSSATKTT